MRILLVEDNPRLAESIQVALVEHGYSVDVARTFPEGDEAALVERHDLIILDVMSAAGDGIDLCRHLRRHKIAAPILLLSSHAATRDKVAGLDAGADDYLTKPFEFEELLARLRSLLRRSQATEGAVLRAGDLEIDLHQRQVRLAGVPVRLSAKELALLEFMMRNPGRLLTRTMISESVWDMNYDSGSNVIDVYVSSLRRKIDRDPKLARIVTMIGSGYRFLEHPALRETALRAPRDS